MDCGADLYLWERLELDANGDHLLGSTLHTVFTHPLLAPCMPLARFAFYPHHTTIHIADGFGSTEASHPMSLFDEFTSFSTYSLGWRTIRDSVSEVCHRSG